MNMSAVVECMSNSPKYTLLSGLMCVIFLWLTTDRVTQQLRQMLLIKKTQSTFNKGSEEKAINTFFLNSSNPSVHFHPTGLLAPDSVNMLFQLTELNKGLKKKTVLLLFQALRLFWPLTEPWIRGSFHSALILHFKNIKPALWFMCKYMVKNQLDFFSGKYEPSSVPNTQFIIMWQKMGKKERKNLNQRARVKIQ